MSLSKYQQFGRSYELTIADAREAKLFKGFNIQATIKKTGDTSPNEAEITIINAKRDNRIFVARRNLNVVLKAGYGNNIGTIFKGSSEFTPSRKEPTDWYLTVNAKDGAINYRGTNVSRSFKKGTPVEKMIREVIKDLQLPPAMDDELESINELALGNLELDKMQIRYQRAQVAQGQKRGRSGTKKNLTFEEFKAKELAKAGAASANADQVKALKGKALMGSAWAQLDLLCRSYGLKWEIRDQTLSIVPAGAPVSSEIILLNRGTGLLGSPETLENGGLSFVSQLRHEINPNTLVFIESRDTKGPFMVKTLEHRLDFQGEWVTACEALPYDDV